MDVAHFTECQLWVYEEADVYVYTLIADSTHEFGVQRFFFVPFFLYFDSRQ